jgi:hypothetical protein
MWNKRVSQLLAKDLENKVMGEQPAMDTNFLAARFLSRAFWVPWRAFWFASGSSCSFHSLEKTVPIYYQRFTRNTAATAGSQHVATIASQSANSDFLTMDYWTKSSQNVTTISLTWPHSLRSAFCPLAVNPSSFCCSRACGYRLRKAGSKSLGKDLVKVLLKCWTEFKKEEASNLISVSITVLGWYSFLAAAREKIDTALWQWHKSM